MPPAAVDAVLDQVRTAEGRDPAAAAVDEGGPVGGGGEAVQVKQARGTVFLYDRPANLREGEVVVMVVSRDMAVARTVHGVLADIHASRERVGRQLMEAAAQRLAEIEVVARDVLAAGPPWADDSGLTESEEKELRRGGFDPDPRDDPATDPVAQARAEYASLLVDSVNVKRVAKLLGVNESRVRQRLTERSLYGIKEGTNWRIPRFQFEGKRVVPSLDAVLPSVRADIHPVALRRWLTTANPDLPLERDDRTVSPLDWLASGGDPAPVVALAQAL